MFCFVLLVAIVLLAVPAFWVGYRYAEKDMRETHD